MNEPCDKSVSGEHIWGNHLIKIDDVEVKLCVLCNKFKPVPPKSLIEIRFDEIVKRSLESNQPHEE